MKTCWLYLIIALITVGCSKGEETILDRIQKSAEAQNITPPKPYEFTKLLPQLAPNFLQQTAQNHTDPVLYQKKMGNIYYFDMQGKLIDKPQKNGFYRQIMGVTDNGLTIAQDFYQDTQTPQTSVFEIKRNGDERNFDTTQNNGTIIYFLPNGELQQMVKLDNGKPIGYTLLFQDKSILMAASEDGAERLLFYPKSQNILAFLKLNLQKNGAEPIILFRQDGSAIVKGRLEAGDWHDVSAWDKNGKSVQLKTVQKEANDTFHQVQATINQLKKFAVALKQTAPSKP